MKKRVNVIYKGQVHGVGFRYTAERIARKYDITGFVRNLPDGSVEIVAEGEEEEIKTFLISVEKEMRGNIQSLSLNWLPYTGELIDFTINYY